eukprot:COSAG06_NODE_531_length_14564_cov_23.708400_8_plen_127_part_00
MRDTPLPSWLASHHRGRQAGRQAGGRVGRPAGWPAGRRRPAGQAARRAEGGRWTAAMQTHARISGRVWRAGAAAGALGARSDHCQHGQGGSVTGSSRQLCPPRTPCTTAAEALPAGELHAANAADM